jgi:hypothetical protein
LTEPFELEHCHGGESNRWAKDQGSLYAQQHVTASIFAHNKPGTIWPCGMNSKVNNNLDIEESDEHHLHL